MKVKAEFEKRPHRYSSGDSHADKIHKLQPLSASGLLYCGRQGPLVLPQWSRVVAQTQITSRRAEQRKWVWPAHTPTHLCIWMAPKWRILRHCVPGLAAQGAGGQHLGGDNLRTQLHWGSWSGALARSTTVFMLSKMKSFSSSMAICRGWNSDFLFCGDGELQIAVFMNLLNCFLYFASPVWFYSIFKRQLGTPCWWC